MRMRRSRYVQLALILALALIVGTCLPPFISRIQERSLLDQEDVEAAEVVSVSRTERMEKKEPMEKFLFLLQPGVTYIEYAAAGGATREQDEARDRMVMEMGELQGWGLLAATDDDKGDFYNHFSVLSEGVYTAANTENPAQSLVVWQYMIMGSYGELYEVTMDDASGKIIGLQMLANQTDALPNLLLVGYEEFAYLWGSYLGMSHMEVQDISYEEVNRKLVMKQWKESYQNFLDMMEMYGFTEDEWYGWGQEIESPYEGDSNGKSKSSAGNSVSNAVGNSGLSESSNVGNIDEESKLSVDNVASDSFGDWFDIDSSISSRQRAAMDADQGIVLDVKYHYGQAGEGAVQLTWNAYTCGFQAVE